MSGKQMDMVKTLLVVVCVFLLSGCLFDRDQDNFQICQEFVVLNKQLVSNQINENQYREEIERLYKQCSENDDSICLTLYRLLERITYDMEDLFDAHSLYKVFVVAACEVEFGQEFKD